VVDLMRSGHIGKAIAQREHAATLDRQIHEDHF
jgi:hypothetical protein